MVDILDPRKQQQPLSTYRDFSEFSQAELENFFNAASHAARQLRRWPPGYPVTNPDWQRVFNEQGLKIDALRQKFLKMNREGTDGRELGRDD